MSELETELHMLALVELLRPAKDRTEAIALMHTKVRPRIVDLSQSQEMLALAIFHIYQLESELIAKEDAADNMLQTQLSKRIDTIRKVKYQTRSAGAKKAADARHSQPGKSRDQWQQIRDIWARGKYTSRDICADQECDALDMSRETARKALRNTPDPA